MHHLTAILILALLFSTFAFAAESPVVATVGAKAITLDDFERRYEEVRKQAVNPPSKKAFLDDLIRYEMGIQEAEKRDLQRDPVIAERMRQELYKGLVERDLADKINAINITDEDLQEYYKTNPEIKTAHILVDIKQNATQAEREAARKRADEIYAEVKKSTRPFKDLVKLYTDDISTRDNGGDVGYQTRVTVYPTYYDAALKLKPGQVSGVVETPYGFHIIKSLDIHPFSKADRRQVKAGLFEKRKLALFNDYFDKLRKHYKVTVNSDSLK